MSISATLAEATLKQTARFLISRSRRSRSSAVSSFESLRPRIVRFSSRITAAATTGPASGPRPTSSTPAISPATSTMPRSLAARRKVLACMSVGAQAARTDFDRGGGECASVALQRPVDGLEADAQRLGRAGIVEPLEGGGGDLRRRRAALQQLGHGVLAQEDVGQRHPRLVVHELAHLPAEEVHHVDDDHRPLEERRLERRRAAGDEGDVAGGERLVGLAVEERDRARRARAACAAPRRRRAARGRRERRSAGPAGPGSSRPRRRTGAARCSRSPSGGCPAARPPASRRRRCRARRGRRRAAPRTGSRWRAGGRRRRR